ncbi:MAG: alpha/beta fold hydrolase [Chloroflexi bacterium]|nr:alpha/beta fold hydrolase [Chloroflexota bacterium]
MEPQIRFCTSADGTRIAYATLGDGPPLLEVPGWGYSLELNWGHPNGRVCLERLAYGRLYVSLDRRGAGASQREVDDFSLESQIADLAAVVDHLQLERFDLLGWVDGTAVAVAYAAQHPERVSRLVLWAAYPCGLEIARPGAVRGLVELIRENWSLARRAIAAVVFPSGPTELQRWSSNTLRESMSPETAAKYLQFQSSVDVRPYLPQVKAPTLLLHRRGDRNVAISAGRATAALIPDARFVTLEGDVAHGFFGDVSYIDTVTQFLDEGRAQEPATEPLEPGAFRTVLFTDVEGSTALTDRLGDAKARELLREHERMIREALKAHGGSEVKTMGDGFMASFSSATKALECAIAMQRAFADWNAGVGAHVRAPEPIRIRIGLNAGEPIAEDDDLFGTAVNLAARIAAQAKGGEILASEAVRQIVAGKKFPFSDRGETALRGFEDRVRIYQVSWREG